MGSFSKALHDFGKALNKDATYTEAWFQRGLTYFKSKQYPQAIYDSSQAIKSNPKMPSAYYNPGLAYQNQNKMCLAQQDFRWCSDWAIKSPVSSKRTLMENNKALKHSLEEAQRLHNTGNSLWVHCWGVSQSTKMGKR